MEMLAAMMSGAAGGAVLRGRSLGLAAATLLGILGGAAAWYLLAQFGPGLKAGPLVPAHMIAGAALGAALVFGAGALRRRGGG